MTSIREKFSPATKKILEEDANTLEGNDVGVYQDSLMNRIAELQEELRALRSRQNSLVPINRFPPEILSKIFIAVGGDRPILRWIQVMHVCQYWRDAGIGCAELWSNVQSRTFRTPGLVGLMLDRSKDSLLSVTFKNSKKRGATIPSELTEVISQTHRLRSLELTDIGGEDNFVRELLEGHSEDALPYLEKLSLVSDNLAEMKFLGPKPIFGGGCPSLKSLEAVSFILNNWMILPLGSSLTNLTIDGRSSDVQLHHPPTNGFIGALSEMKELKHLRIHHFLPYDTPADPTTTPIATLPHLVRLDLMDTIHSVTTFVRSLRFPKTTSPILQIWDRPSQAAFDYLLATLGESWNTVHAYSSGNWPFASTSASRSSRLGIQTLSINNFRSFDRETYRLALNFEFSPKSGHSPLNIDFWDVRAEEPGILFAPVAQHLDMTSIQQLRIVDSDALPEAFWQRFAALKKLNALYFEFSKIHTFLEWMNGDPAFQRLGETQALEVDSSDNGGSVAMTEPATPYFPQLSMLELCEVLVGTGSDSMGDTFFDWLEKRLLLKPLGCPTMQARLRHCESWFDPEDWEEACLMLPDVYVKWVGLGSSDSEDDADDSHDV
ncbi:hypothetical protein D9611_001325 [Ephemerocybe angulata]|uniref:F-box domain-containing protein n=1 Tax=Ephemerocybe angulata TaxID=980116 RepID=A0A8H5CI48_9AGAR|nr:hypothetical protein D9611_001325 [Tulosesus angulatus]